MNLRLHHLAQRTPRSLRRVDGGSLRRKPARTEVASKSKHPLRRTRSTAVTRFAQSLHGAGSGDPYQSSTHSCAFPPRSACPHTPSPAGEVAPTLLAPANTHAELG